MDEKFKKGTGTFLKMGIFSESFPRIG